MSDRAVKVGEAGGGRWPKPFAALRGIKPADVPRDIFDGITLAALIIPLN